MALLLLVLGGLLALGAEFLALLAMQALGVGFLGALDRFGAVNLRGLCHRRRRSRIRLGGRRCRGLGENGSGKQQERRAESGGQAGRVRHEKHLGGLKRTPRLRRDAEPRMNDCTGRVFAARYFCASRDGRCHMPLSHALVICLGYASGPILAFASLLNGHLCECQNQRTTSKYRFLVEFRI